MKILDELFPGVDRRRHQPWLSIIEEGRRNYNQAVLEHYLEVQRFTDDAILMSLANAADDERKRIDGLETKARLVLSMVGILMAIASILAGYLSSEEQVSQFVVTGFVFSIVYLAAGLVFASIGVQVSMRWFLDLQDLTQASTCLQQTVKCVNQKALLAAASLAGTELMANANLRKQNAIDAALRNMRNGLICLAASISFAMCA